MREPRSSRKEIGVQGSKQISRYALRAIMKTFADPKPSNPSSALRPAEPPAMVEYIRYEINTTNDGASFFQAYPKPTSQQSSAPAGPLRPGTT
ncbi:hypothetical protein V492_03097 [Pseudogymnoascus sp. VKM F-4246]|nr:hypothetical protein V492_03097 [Pseudogymnoascus sp. VKM F-4246]